MISNHTEKHKAVPFKQLLVPFNIDGKNIEMNCIDTFHCERLVTAAEYVKELTGCTHKSASIKINMLYKQFPDLRPASGRLHQYTQVYSFLDDSMVLFDTKLFIFRHLWNLCHT